MSDPEFREFDLERDREALIRLLTTETWTYRTRPVLSKEEVTDDLERGIYSSADVITLMIALDGEAVGLVRAEGLENAHEDPQLDFRLRERVQSRGIGLAALHRITETIFSRNPGKHRIEGQTREDNIAMRKVFVRGGYLQVAVYRRAWPAADGQMLDGIGYAILRGDGSPGPLPRCAGATNACRARTGSADRAR